MGARARLAARWGAVVLAACVAAPVQADVLEIAADGAVTTYRGAMRHTDAGAVPIGTAAAPAPPRANDAVGAVRSAIGLAAARYALRREVLEAVAWQESRLRADAVSPKGAVGVMQLMPGTARDLGVDPFDPVQNVAGGAAYLAQLLRRYGGDLRLSLAAYNAGPGAVDRYGDVPPYAETRRYVAGVLARLGQAAP